METAAYYRDAYQCTLDARVVERGTEGDRAFVILDDTILYPEGGGQPADHGTLHAVPVRDVRRVGGRILHFVERFPDQDSVRVELDWARRFDHMQQHSAQHLLSAIADDRFGWPTTAFHLGTEVCDVELAVPSLDESRLRALEDAVAAAVREARSIRARLVPYAELDALAVRTRGLPTDHRGDVRLVEIDGIDVNTCGGTHVRSTAELECVLLIGTEALRGGTRLTFVAGSRVRRRAALSEALHRELRSRLGVPDAGLVEAVDRRADEQRALTRTLRALERERAETLVELLRAQRADDSALLISAHREFADGEFLRLLARPLEELVDRGAALITASAAPPDSSGAFLLVVAESLRPRAQELLAAITGSLSARGGGAGRVLQGKAQDLSESSRRKAVERLRTALGPSGS